jgi:hypothetical protein
MRAKEFLIEGRNHPVICVDVQPEYCGINDGDESSVCVDIIDFVALRQTGPVLMFVNAEDQGQTGDTIVDVQQYWADTVAEITNDYDNEQPINWKRFQIVDKGYGYLRSWMDQGVSPTVIIRVIRAMYQHRISDSREFENIDPMLLPEIVGNEWEQWMYFDPIVTNWTSIAQLKRFSGSYIVGGGRNECLREVELLMNAFNIPYKRIDSLVY